jgi:hypothetical protein
MSWMQHYISLVTQEDELAFDHQDFSKIKSNIKNMALRHAKSVKKLRKSQRFIKVESKKPNNKSLETLIFRILSASSPKHITDIIIELETIGWKSDSLYHKYNIVQRALTANYYTFEKVGIGTYQIRSSIKGIKEPKIIGKKFHIDMTKSIPKMKDLVENVIIEYAPHNDLSASDVHYIITCSMGINCSYSSVRRALQDDRFKRNGKWYMSKWQQRQD